MATLDKALVDFYFDASVHTSAKDAADMVALYKASEGG